MLFKSKQYWTLREANLLYYNNLDTQNLSNNTKFCKAVKHVFTEKLQVSQSFDLLTNGQFISNDKRVAEIFNENFANLTYELENFEKEDNLSFAINNEDPIEKAVLNYQNNPRIKMIKGQWVPQRLFNFYEVDVIDVFDQLERPDQKQRHWLIASIQNCCKKIAPVLFIVFKQILTYVYKIAVFLNVFKKGNISFIFKKGNALNKKKYWPISVLPSVFKIFGRFMEKARQSYAQIPF